MRTRASLAFLAAILPVVGAWVAKVVVWPRPFWAHFYDPETIHFYAGLHLLRGKVPENVDNPGTPLQMVSAVMAAVTGATPARYEAFLAAAHGLELLLLIAGAAILFRGVLAGAPLPARVAGVWLYFCAPQALERMDVWSPEVLYLPLGAAALAAFRRWIDAPSPRMAAVTGAAIGLAIACKFVFLPWAAALVLTMLVRRRVRDAVASAAGTAAGFVIGTLPVVTQYAFIVRRLLFLSSDEHSDENWPALLLGSQGWLVCLAVITVAAVVCVRREQMTLALFCVAAIALSVLSTLRNPSFRYLLPAAIAVVGLLAAAASAPRFTRAWRAAVLGLTAVLLAKGIAGDLRVHRQRIATSLTTREAIAAALPADAIVLYGWRTPVPSFALRVMTHDARYLAEVARLYPREGHFSPWNRRVYGPAGWTHAAVNPSDAEHLRSDAEVIGSAGGFVVMRRRAGR